MEPFEQALGLIGGSKFFPQPRSHLVPCTSLCLSAYALLGLDPTKLRTVLRNFTIAYISRIVLSNQRTSPCYLANQESPRDAIGHGNRERLLWSHDPLYLDALLRPGSSASFSNIKIGWNFFFFMNSYLIKWSDLVDRIWIGGLELEFVRNSWCHPSSLISALLLYCPNSKRRPGLASSFFFFFFISGTDALSYGAIND